jgi:SAM-dependent methyltransferase
MNKEYLPYDSSGVVDYYGQVYTGFWSEFPSYLVEDYIEQVKQVQGSRGLVLCVGSGLGNEAEMLQAKGLSPLCLDGSRQMVRSSASRNLPTIQGNFLNLPFAKAKFDGVWTYKTLNHALDMN